MYLLCILNLASLCSFLVFSSGMDRLYGNPIELSTKASIVDPVDFISGYDHDGDKKKSGLFIGRNNTEIWAHAGSNVVFDCLVGRPDIKEHGPVSFTCTLHLQFFIVSSKSIF